MFPLPSSALGQRLGGVELKAGFLFPAICGWASRRFLRSVQTGVCYVQIFFCSFASGRQAPLCPSCPWAARSILVRRLPRLLFWRTGFVCPLKNASAICSCGPRPLPAALPWTWVVPIWALALA